MNDINCSGISASTSFASIAWLRDRSFRNDLRWIHETAQTAQWQKKSLSLTQNKSTEEAYNQ